MTGPDLRRSIIQPAMVSQTWNGDSSKSAAASPFTASRDTELRSLSAPILFLRGNLSRNDSELDRRERRERRKETHGIGHRDIRSCLVATHQMVTLLWRGISAQGLEAFCLSCLCCL